MTTARSVPPVRRKEALSTEARYRRGLKNWQHSKPVRIMGWICLPVAAALLLFASRHGLVPTYLGFFAGAIAAVFLWVRIDPPAYVEQLERGGEGERWTSKELAKLDPNEWHVVHDRTLGYGNLDHVVVGPRGVYLLDSKNLAGRVYSDGKQLRVERRLDPEIRYVVETDFVRNQARQLYSRIAKETGLLEWVQIVIVVWGDFAEREVELDGIVYVAGTEVTSWLRQRPTRISDRAAKRVASSLDTLPRAEL